MHILCQVYAQVQVLFRGAPDLLDEFKQFLPDPNANNANASLAPAGVGSMPVQSMPIAMAPSGVAGRKGTAMVGGVPPAMAYRPGPHVYQQAAVVSTDASKYKRMAPGSFPVGAKVGEVKQKLLIC